MPRGALTLSAAATCKSSVPGVWPLWSSGTVSVEQTNPAMPAHGCDCVRSAAGAALVDLLAAAPWPAGVHAEAIAAANTARTRDLWFIGRWRLTVGSVCPSIPQTGASPFVRSFSRVRVQDTV